ncbi:MAG: superoxide dismutase family protein [Kofleriaceae bacterium]
MKLQLLALALVAACGSSDVDGNSQAEAAITGFMGGTVTGTAMFTQSGTDVTVTITLDGCTAGKSYPVHIHTGPACTDMASQGGHWDMTRGEGIPLIACTGTQGTSTLTRPATDTTLAWSIGGETTTDVIGHLVVVHDADVPATRIGCGPIAAM